MRATGGAKPVDPWRFWAVTHKDLDIMNPLGSAKLDLVVDRVAPTRGSRAVDIACGKGEWLMRLSSRYGVHGLGLDISPYNIEDAKRRAHRRGAGARVRFVLGDGRGFVPEGAGSFAAASCLGATWIFDGFEGTLRALSGWVQPRGFVVVGHPFWRVAPADAYLAADGLRREDYGSHDENLAVGDRLGLRLVDFVASSVADFDAYESRQWRALEAFSRANPADPDLGEFRRRVDLSKSVYLRWGRDTLGWAVYIFRV